MPEKDRDLKQRRKMGRQFERQAALFFKETGFEILEQNYFAGHREIDLIVKKENLIVFVEVKSSSSKKFGHPVERVDSKKIINLTKAAQHYLKESEIENCDLRFDIVTFIDGKIEHFPNAFEAME